MKITLHPIYIDICLIFSIIFYYKKLIFNTKKNVKDIKLQNEMLIIVLDMLYKTNMLTDNVWNIIESSEEDKKWIELQWNRNQTIFNEWFNISIHFDQGQILFVWQWKLYKFSTKKKNFVASFACREVVPTF